jgi:hypothetical protein
VTGTDGGLAVTRSIAALGAETSPRLDIRSDRYSSVGLRVIGPRGSPHHGLGPTSWPPHHESLPTSRSRIGSRPALRPAWRTSASAQLIRIIGIRGFFSDPYLGYTPTASIARRDRQPDERRALTIHIRHWRMGTHKLMSDPRQCAPLGAGVERLRPVATRVDLRSTVALARLLTR